MLHISTFMLLFRWCSICGLLMCTILGTSTKRNQQHRDLVILMVSLCQLQGITF
jgi:hypothetical protein